jgi:hypothetical protein
LGAFCAGSSLWRRTGTISALGAADMRLVPLVILLPLAGCSREHLTDLPPTMSPPPALIDGAGGGGTTTMPPPAAMGCAGDADCPAGQHCTGAEVMTCVDNPTPPVDAGEPPPPADAGEPPPVVDAGAPETADAGSSCTATGVSPELQMLQGGPYQNCQGGSVPFTMDQMDTQTWSGCCGVLVRVCAVMGYSSQNVMYCD